MQFRVFGNVEIHVRSSDWIKHGHEKDRNYDRIILHVVYEYDAHLEQNEYHGVETLELKGMIPDLLLRNYNELSSSESELACGNAIELTNPFLVSSWLERMLCERLEQKYHLTNELCRSFMNANDCCFLHCNFDPECLNTG